MNENDQATLAADFSNPDTTRFHEIIIDWDDPNAALDLMFSLPSTASLNVGDSFNSSTDAAVLSITFVDTATGQVSFESNHHYLDDGIAPGNGSATDVSTVAVSIVESGQPGTTFRVSVDSMGNEGSASSSAPHVSEDGQIIAFHSYASNLVAGDTNGASDIFVHDRQTGQTTRVSVSSAGVEANSIFGSSDPSISADGRYVAFISSGTNLVSGDTNNIQDVFVHDRQTGQTERVSVSSTGSQANGGLNNPFISADGRYVTFASTASNLVAGDSNGVSDIFVHDRQTGQTSRVSTDSAGNHGNNHSEFPVISGDGRFVAFQSVATNLVVGDTNSSADIFVHDRQMGQTVRASKDSSGNQANSASLRPAISRDGHVVAYESSATNMVSGDSNGFYDIFVHDVPTGQTTRVSIDSSEHQALGGDSLNPSVSSDGRFVSFVSHANNLITGDLNNQEDIFVHDRQTGETIRASVDSNGNEANDWSTNPSISADGQFAAFYSHASNLVTGDTNGKDDVFLSAITFSGISSTPQTLTFQEGNNGYTGTTDHWINGEFPDSDTTDTYGEDFVLVDGITGGGDILRQGFLKFDNLFGTGGSQIPPDSTIINATLTLWVINNGDSGEILRLLTGFNEGVTGVSGGDTWNDWGDGLNGHNLVPGVQSDGSDPEATQLLPLSDSMFAPVPTAPLTINVTSSLQIWSDNPNENYGWLFRSFDGNGWDFRSSENPSATERPLLTVEYEAPTGSTSASIANVAPTFTAPDFNAGGDETLPPGQLTFARSIPFVDPGTLDVHTVTVNFGDNSGDQSMTIPQGNRDFDLNHTYTQEGIFSVSVSIKDDDLGVLSDTFMVEVNCGLTVMNTNDSGAGSLRDAIDCSNTTPGVDTIDFSIPGSGPHSIQPLSPLPVITDSVVIDGYTQSGSLPNTNPPTAGSNASLQVVVDGSLAGASANGLTITAGGSSVRGLVINQFDGNGIEVSSAGGNKLQGNFLGTDISGSLSLGNGDNGVRIFGATAGSNIIGTDGDGNDDTGEGNVISANGADASSPTRQNLLIFQSNTQNVIAGNLIGTNAAGTDTLANGGVGIDISDGSSFSRIGTDGDGVSDDIERNVIYGNITAGVRLRGAPSVTGTLITGNLIGTDVTGMEPVANLGIGVQLTRAVQSQIGTNGDGHNDAVERNIISANTADGIFVSGLPLSTTSPGENLIHGNYIGADITGTSPLGNGANGVRIEMDNQDNQIGGLGSRGNTIAFNALTGIRADASVMGSTISRNSIHSNLALGIDLNGDGVTANDPGDGDTGSNQLQNFPVITSAISTGGTRRFRVGSMARPVPTSRLNSSPTRRKIRLGLVKARP